MHGFIEVEYLCIRICVICLCTVLQLLTSENCDTSSIRYTFFVDYFYDFDWSSVILNSAEKLQKKLG